MQWRKFQSKETYIYIYSRAWLLRILNGRANPWMECGGWSAGLSICIYLAIGNRLRISSYIIVNHVY